MTGRLGALLTARLQITTRSGAGSWQLRWLVAPFARCAVETACRRALRGLALRVQRWGRGRLGLGLLARVGGQRTLGVALAVCMQRCFTRCCGVGGGDLPVILPDNWTCGE